jgi:HK97 family phage prohead protease
MERETRVVAGDGIEVRESASGEPRGIAGTAAVYNTPTVIGRGSPWAFEERIAPGAFRDVVAESDVVGLFNHDPNIVLGRTSSNTMSLRDTDDGLRYEIPDLPRSRADVLESVKRRDVQGNSFSFSVDREEDEEWIPANKREDGGDMPLRIIKRFGSLHDVGPVTFPAYKVTQVSARCREKAEGLTDTEKRGASTCSRCVELESEIARLEDGIQRRDELIDRMG